jgi:Uma2 family endonuclease
MGCGMSGATATRLWPPDQRVTFRASWELYQLLAREIGDQPVRLAYDHDMVELMSPSPQHEDFKVLLERLVGALTDEAGVPCKGMGSTRWDRPEAWRGLEADATFYLTSAKIAEARQRPRDAADYPVPDLAVAVDLSPSRLDRPAIYAALGVPEVWRFDGAAVRIARLGETGQYEELHESPTLGIRADEIAHWLLEVTAEDDNDWTRQLRAWYRGRQARE